ncbi:MAG: hypothetical protein ACRDHO_02700 [Actinomycetota bacterium]
MSSRETIEGRIYLAEDAMYRRSGELNRQLHELESRLKDLTASVHRVLCESGRMPLEARTDSIVQAIEAFEAGIDLGEIRAKAGRVSSLRGLVECFERELEESSRVPGSTPEAGPVLKALAEAC